MRFLFIVCFFIVLFSCKRKDEVDLSAVDVAIELCRFDRELFSLSFDSLEEQSALLRERHPLFFDIYMQKIISVGSHMQASFVQNLQSFLTDYTINLIWQETEKRFSNEQELNSSFTEAFKRYAWYFPGHPIPQVYTFIAGFNQSIVVADSLLAIGLDKYLGSGCPLYFRVGFPRYQRLNMYPEKIVPDALKGFLLVEFPFDEDNGKLIHYMLYNGKILYCLDKLFPAVHDTIKTGFTRQQLDFCMQNERRMWTYLVEQKLLFSTDMFTIKKFTGEGPFTKDFTNKSPAGAANWIGWQMIKRYMQHEPHQSLSDLMKDKDYPEIMRKARYNP